MSSPKVRRTTARRIISSAPLVSIIVVNYNGMAYLPECLGALTRQRYPNLELLMVDCRSSDGSVAYVLEHFPGVTVLPSERNLGYAGAVNFALPFASGAYVAVLNMDAIVDPAWLEPLVALLEAHADVGAVTPKILLYDRPAYVNALGQNIHITALGFNRGYNQPDRPERTAPFQVAGLHGAAFVIRRDLLERMDGMNEACFLYHEDVDLSWMTRLMGYEIYCVPSAVVHHKYTLKMEAQKLFYLERNRVAMLLTNLRWRTLALIAPFLLLTELMMLAYCLLKGPAFLYAKLRSFAWIWGQRERIRRRRAIVGSLRRRSDWQIIAGLNLMYEWDQLLTLGRALRSHQPGLKG